MKLTIRVFLTMLTYISVVSIFAVPAQELGSDVAARDTSSIGNLMLREVVVGLDHPWAVAPLPGGALLITERPGRLWYLSAGPERELRRVSGVPDLYARGQGGLLDIIISDRFSRDNTVYFSYSAGKRGGAVTAVARARLDVQPGGVGLRDVESIFELNRVVSGGRHFGSRLALGPEGYLYITVGERGQPEQAQDPTNHQGSVVRVAPDGSIPPENPQKINDPRGGTLEPAPGLFSWGHRNAQGMARHPETGEIWLHEHGPRGGDEINIVSIGANYGWPLVTHGVAYSGREITDTASRPGYEDPLLHWTPSIAPSGLAFVTSPRFSKWNGDILVGALAGRHLRRVDLDAQETVIGEETLFSGFARFRDVRQGPGGEIYILTDESPDGGLYRLERR
ncbi:MAG: PQQ-dependent sugar dehydrogenase [Spirochaeta sp.]|jgi:glucose/arabinose dehydrogenase|nr:PQQ-dependent sugar dehydrogenase [Spirochaeta sp.]